MIPQDEILEMAKQVGMVTKWNTEHLTIPAMQRFAELVEARTREECARTVEATVKPLGHSFGHWSVVGEECAAAIRGK